MCDVHLIPKVSEVRKAARKTRCGECNGFIKKGDDVRFIEGTLDNGTGHQYRYVAHEDCYQFSTTDVGEDGCFQYRGAMPL